MYLDFPFWKYKTVVVGQNLPLVSFLHSHNTQSQHKNVYRSSSFPLLYTFSNLRAARHILGYQVSIQTIRLQSSDTLLEFLNNILIVSDSA